MTPFTPSSNKTAPTLNVEAGVLIITSAVGTCAPPACADMTEKQQEREGERDH